jgi:predicted porin
VKKLLLGTTAFVSAGAAASGAFADSQPIKMGIGGYWKGAFGDVVDESPCNQTGATKNNSSCNHHHQGMMQDTLLDFNGSTALDNGLTVTVHVQLRGIAASSSTDTEKRSYVEFRGNFGEVRFGDQDDARVTMSLTAPTAGSLFGVNTPFFAFTNNPVGTNSTSLPIDVHRAQRIAYFSPRIAGVRLGASYTPDSRKGNLSSPGLPTDNDAGQNSQHWDIALDYDQKFGDFKVLAYGAVSGTHQEAPRGGLTTTPVVSPYAYAGGAQVSWGPFSFGGDYELVTNHRSTGTAATNTGGGRLDDHVFDLGFLYTRGPFSVSIDWSRGTYRGFAGSNGGVCTVACSADSILNTEELVFDYVLGPGIAIGAALEFDQYRSGVDPGLAIGGGASPGSANNYHNTSIEFGTSLTF